MDGCIVEEAKESRRSLVQAVSLLGVQTQKRDALTCVPTSGTLESPRKDAFDAPQLGAQIDAVFVSSEISKVSR